MSYYKYTTLNTTKLIIQNKSLRWSSPLKFNDIEECQFVPYTKDSYEKAIKEYLEIITKIAKGVKVDYDYNRFKPVTQMLIGMIQLSINQGTFDPSNFAEQSLNTISNPEADYREYINNGLIRIFRILCVTNKYDNKLMWAHYGDQHYGCVIEFTELYLKKPFNLKEGYVEYHENLNPKTNSLELLLYGETPEIRNVMIQDVIFSKRADWKYEEEYRLLFSENFGEIKAETDFETKKTTITASKQTDKLFTDVPISKDFIKSICFGTRVKDEEITDIQRQLSDNNIDCLLYKMKLNGGNLERIKLTKKDYS